jgi:hypothetical protein
MEEDRGVHKVLVGNVWVTGEMHTCFWWGGLRERHHLEYVGVDGKIILKRIFKNWNEVRGLD